MTAARMGAWALAVAGCLLVPGEAHAQANGRVEMAFGALWIGGVGLDSADANLTTPDGGRRRLFETHTDLRPVRAFDAAVSVRIGRSLRVGATVSMGRAELRTSISADAEGVADTTVSERLTEFAIGGAVVVDLSRAADARLRPFASASAGHLRHLHERRRLVETGQIYQLGGGVDYLLRMSRRPALGLRGEARAVLRSRGLFFDDDVHVSPALTGALFVRF